MEDGTREVHLVPEVVPHQQTTLNVETVSEQTHQQTDTIPESGLGPNIVHDPTAIVDESAKTSELGCSICTEDFTKGEDVRVLPCNHKYHPACIDPWLLNVSGTCPLCRVDLRPAPSVAAETAPAADGELPPPLTETEAGDPSTRAQRSRASRILDLAHMRHAPAHERIAALRQLRVEQQREGGGSATDVEERGRSSRLTGRLRDVFRIRTRTESVPDETDLTTATNEAGSSNNENASART